MYKCSCCGYEFDVPEPYQEPAEVWGYPTHITSYGCPICGGGYCQIGE